VRQIPILMSAPMVRASLEDLKTQTRRVIPDDWWRCLIPEDVVSDPAEHARVCALGPYGVPGDRLWVRESLEWRINQGQMTNGIQHPPEPPTLAYVADGAEVRGIPEEFITLPVVRTWIPSIHMPRWACRLILEVVSVRVDRLHDIGKDGRKAHDVLAEGIDPEAIKRHEAWFHPDDCPALAFGALWESINGPGSWDANPWVWVVEFKVVKP